MLTDIVDGNDVWVLKPTGGARLAQEASSGFLVVDPQKLERDQSINGRVERKKQRTHTALADALAHLVAADGWGQWLHGERR